MPAEQQEQAKAFGDATRHRIFRYVAEAPDPVRVAELTRFVGLSHNAVRQHLAVLKSAGPVIDELEARRRPGRPRLMYRLHPEAAGTWGTPRLPAHQERPGCQSRLRPWPLPLRDVAVANRDTVCRAHLGPTEGVVDGLDGIEVLRLVSKDPRRAGCRLKLSRSNG